jgi:N-acetylglucosamine-6-phosphate deacetylase
MSVGFKAGTVSAKKVAEPRFNRAAGCIMARRYDTGEAVKLTFDGPRIAQMDSVADGDAGDDWPLVAPGLFDLQVNGFGGTWFADRNLTAEQAAAAIKAYIPHGVTRLCPTLVTSSFETLAGGFAAIRQACETNETVGRVVAGCHLEGPYLSGEDGPRGAHPREHIRPADWDEFCELQKISGDRICLVTIAPEVPHAIEFIRRAVASGVAIAIGHTAATGEQIAAAVDAGATLSTHLGNGAHPVLRRHPNYIWDQLGEPRLTASLIADGQHLPDSVIRSMVWAKSVEKTVLTCDSSGWVGCPPGMYENDLGRIEILPSGRIVVAGQDLILGGSSSTTEMCVAHAVRCGAASLRDAIDMASRNPARVLGFQQRGLVPGDTADLIVFRYVAPGSPIEVVASIIGGKIEFGTLPAI